LRGKGLKSTLRSVAMVMYLGKIVESGETEAVVHWPKHPYTQALISALPQIDPTGQRTRIVLTGEMPSPVDPPPGCPFHPRCPLAEARCRSEAPELREVAPGHWASCHFAK
jgi:oligopeptide/dipeptide ABC transporter ATP-binding protein